jgi:hypothetical protein
LSPPEKNPSVGTFSYTVILFANAASPGTNLNQLQVFFQVLSPISVMMIEKPLWDLHKDAPFVFQKSKTVIEHFFHDSLGKQVVCKLNLLTLYSKAGSDVEDKDIPDVFSAIF